jgi:hypothetical protein
MEFVEYDATADQGTSWHVRQLVRQRNGDPDVARQELIYSCENDITFEERVSFSPFHTSHLKRCLQIGFSQIGHILLIESGCQSAKRESVEEPIRESDIISFGVNKSQQCRPTLTGAGRSYKNKILSAKQLASYLYLKVMSFKTC